MVWDFSFRRTLLLTLTPHSSDLHTGPHLTERLEKYTGKREGGKSPRSYRCFVTEKPGGRSLERTSRLTQEHGQPRVDVRNRAGEGGEELEVMDTEKRVLGEEHPPRSQHGQPRVDVRTRAVEGGGR